MLDGKLFFFFFFEETQSPRPGLANHGLSDQHCHLCDVVDSCQTFPDFPSGNIECSFLVDCSLSSEPSG